jgi:hypothetical protein
MHAAVLLSTMVTHGLVMPPVEKYRMDEQLRAERPRVVIDFLRTVDAEIIQFKGLRSNDSTGKNKAYPWSDGGVFKSPLPENLGYSGMDFILPPSRTELKMNIINCGSDEKAKEVFLQLRLRRIPDYARSGKFLIKADEDTFKWFLRHFGAERYQVRRTYLLFW